MGRPSDRPWTLPVAGRVNEFVREASRFAMLPTEAGGPVAPGGEGVGGASQGALALWWGSIEGV